MGFGSDAIAVVTAGLRYATGTFAERLVSRGLVGDILTLAGSVTWFWKSRARSRRFA